MNRLFIKWSYLTDEQQKQVKIFFKEDLEKKRIIINQRYFHINPFSGNFMNHMI